ncbi:MAG: hypothetical protein PVI81_00325 [Anaerolineales bacterium]|jgi:hypothetical protein
MSEYGSKIKPQTWHFADWPPLAWLETVIKLFALLLAILTSYRGIQHWPFEFPTGLVLAQWIIMLVLSFGLGLAIIDRVQNREILAMGFIILNNLGHWGMTYTLMTHPGPGSLLSVFAALMLIGDLIKLLFIRLNSFTVRDLPRSVLYGLTGIYIAGYLAILLLELIR